MRGWANVYSNDNFAAYYESKEEADAHANLDLRIDCRKIRYTEGVGIEDVTDEVSDE